MELLASLCLAALVVKSAFAVALGVVLAVEAFDTPALRRLKARRVRQALAAKAHRQEQAQAAAAHLRFVQSYL